MEGLFKGLATAFFSFIFPKIKNKKFVRDFKDKWVKDNYPEKMVLMFEAGVDDAKAILDIPDEVIKELLEDKINRQEIFRWLIEGVLDDEFVGEHFFLDPYYERYPQHQDKMIPFFQLILLKINEYKEKNWDPEFQNILNGINSVKQEMRKGFERIEMQNERNVNRIHDSIQSAIVNALGPVGFEDLKELLDLELVITARKKAEERLKHTHSAQEKLELNIIIANSYMNSNRGKEAIPFLYTAISLCEDESRKNRFFSLINIFDEKLEEALKYVQKNITSEGYTKNNLELLLNIYFLQKDYDKCLKMIEKYADSNLKELKAQILLCLNEFNKVFDLVEEELAKNPKSKDWLLIKADAYILQLEHFLSIGESANPEEIINIVIPLLEQVELENENDRLLMRVKELFAGIYFRTKQFKEAAFYYEEVYRFSRDDRKELYFKNLIWSSFLGEKWDHAIQLLKNMIKESDNIEYFIMLARVYMETGNPKEALITLDSYETLIRTKEDFPLDLYFLKLEVLYRLFKHKEILSFINEVEEKGHEYLVSITKGYYAILQDDWDLAILNLEKALEISVGKDQLEIKIQLISAYRKRRKKEDYHRLTDLIPNIPHWIHHESFVNTFVQSLYELGKYERVLSYFYNDIKQPSTLVKSIVASIYFQSEWYELSKNLYEELFHQTEEVNFLFQYSNCLFRLGNTEGCLNTLQLAENKVRENTSIEDIQLLALAYLDAMEYEKALEYAYLTLKYGEKNPDVWRFYFAHYLQLTQFLGSPKQEYTDAYQKVWTSFHETFPNERELFKQLKAIEDDGQIAEEFLTELKSSQSSQVEIEELFIKYKMPLQTFLDLTKKDPSLIWAHVANHEKLHFSVYQQGSIDEVQKGVQNVVQSNWILCDLFSIFTLDYLGLLDFLTKEFQLYIYQGQFNSLFNEYSHLKLSRHKGLKTLSYENGKIRGYEWGPDEIEESIIKKETLIQWINNNCKKLGKASVNPTNHRDKTLFEDQLQLCKDSSITILVDNFIIRDHGKTKFEVNSFSVVDFITYLLLKKKIDKETHDQLIGKLIMIGFRYMCANSDVFIYFLKKNQFNIEGEVEWLFRYLREEGVSREYVLSVVIEVLNWISHEGVENEEQIEGYFCDIIVGDKENAEWLNELLLICDKMMEWNPKFFSKVKEVISTKIPYE